jgi:hypothetical protein
MNKQEAEKIAREYIRSIVEDKSLAVEIIEDETIEKPYGWIFFYQSKQYLDTRDIRHVLVGNGPILVIKSGAVIHFPSAIPEDEAIRRFAAGLPLIPR